MAAREPLSRPLSKAQGFIQRFLHIFHPVHRGPFGRNRPPTEFSCAMSQSRHLIVIAHAPSENTRRMVDAVLRGAGDPAIENVDSCWIPPLEAGPEDILDADAVILGTTENLGYMSGALKDFFDRSYYPCLDKTQGLPFAFYIRAGQDGTGTRRALESITTGLRWRRAREPLVCRGAFQEGFIGQCEELGAYMAASLDAGLI